MPLLGPLAELRFGQIVAETDPELAAHVSHHDSATVARLYAELGDGQPRGDTRSSAPRRPTQFRPQGRRNVGQPMYQSCAEGLH